MTIVVQRCGWCGDEFRVPLRWLRSQVGGHVDTSTLEEHEAACPLRVACPVDLSTVGKEARPAAGAEAAAAGRSAPVEGVRTRPVSQAARELDAALTVVLMPGRLVNPGGGELALERPPASVDELIGRVAGAVRCILVGPAGAAWAGLDAGRWLVDVTGSTGQRVSVVFLGADERGFARPFSDLDGAELVDGLAAFRRAVGVCWGPSIGATAERVLLATHNTRRGGARLGPSVMPPAVGELAEIGSMWRRPLSDDECAARFVHWFDANANYLGAYQTALLGRGEPYVVAGDDLAGVLERRYLPPGIWHAKLPGGTIGGLPMPWSTSAAWHTSPTIGRARELGAVLEVDEAWVWPVAAGQPRPGELVASRFCEPFGALLRDARAQLLDDGDAPGAAVAVAAIGRLYQRLHGRFGAGFRAGTSSPWWRPDWMHTIRAQARVNLDRRMRQLTAVPFAVDVDAFYFTSELADPLELAGAIGLPVGPRAKLGAFRPAGTVELTVPIVGALTGIGTSAGTRNLLTSLRDGRPLATMCGGVPSPADLATVAEFGGLLAEQEVDDVDDGAELDELEAALRG